MCFPSLTLWQSYACGVTNVYAWISTTAGIAIIIAQVILGMVIFYQPDYVPETWHYFLVYQAINALVCIHNIFTLKKTMWVNDVSCESTLKHIPPNRSQVLNHINSCRHTHWILHHHCDVPGPQLSETRRRIRLEHIRQ